jgi:hypothetical protein
MAKVITYSRTFPSYHPKVGQPTYFVEAIYKNLGFKWKDIPNVLIEQYVLAEGFSKGHTIRSGKRFKKGDFFSPRVWSGKPYQSKQIILSKDIEIANVWDIIILVQDFGKLGLQAVITIDGKDFQNIELLAKNDGLSIADFLHWFKTEKGEVFVGQIICWDDSVSY